MKRILFVCVENSCRSQMAEAFARRRAGQIEEPIEVYSAGSAAAGRVNPRAIEFMAEAGYDLSEQQSTSVDDLPQTHFDYVITMGCGDACPYVPAERREDWDLADPKNLPNDEFRRIRDEISARVDALFARFAAS